MSKRTLSILVVLALAVVPGFRALHAGPAVPESTVQIAHLLNRAAFGPKPGDVESVRKIGVAPYLDEQLHPERIDDSALDVRLNPVNTLDARAVRSIQQNDPRPILEQLQAQKLVRAVYSKRQLQEVMVDFWFNHFNVSWSKEGMQPLVAGYERDAIRPHVFDKFKDLLMATAKSPAMLVYLDNAWSATPDVNENYARELMELHTMGVDGGYTQKDVVEVARCLTGWTVNRQAADTPFEFNPKMHDNGEKVVLGHTIKAGGGIQDGEQVIDILAHHPATARFIATKLVRRLVSDEPPATLVDRVAKVFMTTDGDLREMTRTILTSEEFSDRAAIGAKVKSPFEMVVSTMRAVEADLQASVDQRDLIGAQRALPPGTTELSKIGAVIRVSPAVFITKTIEQMGQYLYQVQEPTGLPDRASYWMGGWELMHRLDFEKGLVNNEIFGTTVNGVRLASRFTGDPEAPEVWKVALGVLTGVSEVAPAKVSATPDILQLFVIALGSPEFQHK